MLTLHMLYTTVANLADSVAIMRQGKIVESGSTGRVLEPPHHEYTALLLNSISKLQPGWLEAISPQ